MKKEETKFLRIFCIIALTLLLIGSIGDLQISKAFMNQGSIFGTIFQTFGEFPAALVPFISAEIIFTYGLKQENTFVKTVLALSGLGLAYWSAWGWIDDIMYYSVTTLSNMKHHLPLGAANNNLDASATYSFALEALLTFIVFLIGTAICYRWLRNKTMEQFRYLVIAAISGVAVIYFTHDTVNTMKENWGRFRPYEVKEIVATSKVSFTNWWHLNGAVGGSSFPSGHETSAIAGMFLPFFVDRKAIKWQKIMTYAAFIYALLMLIARLRIGAHFLSDVTVAMIIGTFITFVTMKFLGYRFIEDENELSAVQD